jgi:nucleotide-binding universal stress UspA family protein
MARQAEEKIASRETSTGARKIAAVATACREAGVRFSGDVVAGDPYREIGKASAACDLLVCGIGARFAYGGSDSPGHLVLSLMKDRATPVLLGASPYRPVRTVIVGCGGGERSARAAGAMARLALWREETRVVLLAVASSPAEAEAHLSEPRRIFAEAGYPPPEERMTSGPKIERFLAFCEEASADAVVLGGWGEHRWDDFLGLSITGRLISASRHHLFLSM